MMSTNNILSPANGRPIIVPSQDIVLGCYYMTRSRAFALGEGKIFSDPDEVRMAYDSGIVHLQAKIKCRVDGELVDTTVGRCILWEIIPKPLTFDIVNRTMGKKELASLIDAAYRKCTAKETVILADQLKDMGYTQATKAGISIAVGDLTIPNVKERMLGDAQVEVKEIQQRVLRRTHHEWRAIQQGG